MKRKNNILVLLVMLLLISSFSFAQDSTKTDKELKIEKQLNSGHRNFIDADGDGYNDNAPDHDGDGIPNGLDPDYIKLGKRENSKPLEYIDSDGDGINDNLQFKGRGRMRNRRFRKSDNGLFLQSPNVNREMESIQKQTRKGKGKG